MNKTVGSTLLVAGTMIGAGMLGNAAHLCRDWLNGDGFLINWLVGGAHIHRAFIRRIVSNR